MALIALVLSTCPLQKGSPTRLKWDKRFLSLTPGEPRLCYSQLDSYTKELVGRSGPDRLELYLDSLKAQFLLCRNLPADGVGRLMQRGQGLAKQTLKPILPGLISIPL